MDQQEFERLLVIVADRLTQDVRSSNSYHKPSVFEDRVREVVSQVLDEEGYAGAMDAIVQGFPDIVVGSFGIEVKATESDSWRCIANSVSEGKRALEVDNIYVMYGKMGGRPEVKWADYGESIIHVRTSHVPRFEIEIGVERSLFKQMDIKYEDFRVLEMHEKMQYIREYARSRLGEGERLWWLEDKEEGEQEHSLSLTVKIYMDLPQEEKRRMRAESALLCPQVVGGSRQRRKYTDAVLYLITYRGVLCPQARDLFSAGSVAGKDRGGHYVSRAFADIQDEMRIAAYNLEDALFREYWGNVPEPKDRILEWLHKADRYAQDWRPSEIMFLEEQGKA